MTDAEFGVPFPGRELPRERWTTTGWRGTRFDWNAVFGREAPRVLDFGCGNGRYLIGSALARPECDHLGIDLVQVAIDHAARRANRRGLTNVRFAVGDAVTWLFETLDIADEIHVYHPQPYYEQGEVGKRMFTPEFLDRAWRVLRPGGMLVVQTDNKSYWQYLLQAVPKYFDLEIVKGAWPDSPRTRREIVARRQGLAVWRGVGRRREAPTDAAIARPDFDANRPRFRRS